jgi:hypothetical protein
MTKSRNDAISHEELATIIKLSMTELDLKFVEEIAGLRLDITNMVHSKIENCQAKQERRRRFSVGAIISSLGAIVALTAAILSHF